MFFLLVILSLSKDLREADSLRFRKIPESSSGHAFDKLKACPELDSGMTLREHLPDINNLSKNWYLLTVKTSEIMKRIIVLIIPLIFFALSPANAQQIEVRSNDASPSIIGTPSFFTGHVVIEMYFSATEHTVGTGAHVTFAPGARTAWHSHPAGQHLLVTSGTGWVQEWGGERQQIKAGDIIWTPPGVKHWHGATESNAMGHIAIQETVNGSPVEWMEHVSDEQYQQGNQ